MMEKGRCIKEKKRISCIACVVLVLFLKACGTPAPDPAPEQDALHEHQISMMVKLYDMGTVFVDDPEINGTKKTPYDKNCRVLQDFIWDEQNHATSDYDKEWTISLEKLQWCIYEYELCTESTFALKPEEIYDLFYEKDDDKMVLFDELYQWLTSEFGYKTRKAMSAISLWKIAGHYLDQIPVTVTEFSEFSTDDMKAIVQWVQEHPDFEYEKENKRYRELLYVLGVYPNE